MPARTKTLVASLALALLAAGHRPAAAAGIRYSVWDSSYTTPNAGRISCRIEFNDSQGRYVLGNGQVGHLYNVRYNRATRNIDASWSFGGQHGVVRFEIQNNDTIMSGIWGYVPSRDIGLWNGRRLDNPNR